MFDISFPELILLAIVALLVIGPERLPETLRTVGLWIGRIRRSFTSVKAELEREIGMDDIRRQLHNEAVMEELKRIEREVRNAVDPMTASGETSGASPENRIEPPANDSTAQPVDPSEGEHRHG
jgi:sec-independent protein translocase protein TatB